LVDRASAAAAAADSARDRQHDDQADDDDPDDAALVRARTALLGIAFSAAVRSVGYRSPSASFVSGLRQPVDSLA
jgi:hypothetical protein